MSKNTKYLAIGIALGIVAHILYLNMNTETKP